MSLVARYRRHEKDTSPRTLIFHLLCSALSEEKTAGEIDLHHPIKILRLVFKKITEQRDPRIGYGNIDRSKLAHGCIYHGLDKFPLRCVSGHWNTNPL